MNSPQDNEGFIEIWNLTKQFHIGKQILNAVNDVNLSISRGKTVGLVGESGCGKSTLGKCLLRLQEPTSGSVFYEGTNICHISKKAMRLLRRKMQIIFQDPYSSLNPRMTIREIINEPLEIHCLALGKRRNIRIQELLEQVGLNPNCMNRYPNEFSGGQRQRIAIARALAVEPDFIVCDEPLSALDVSIQAQIVNLLKQLQKDLKLTYLFIAHDLSMVEYLADHVAVMYQGKIVEFASSEQLYRSPSHPYTKTLFSAIPIPDPKKKCQSFGILRSGDFAPG